MEYFCEETSFVMDVTELLRSSVAPELFIMLSKI